MASIPDEMTLLLTKFHRPPVPLDHVHRIELVERLEKNLRRPLTLVSAPAGYGKSTLVSCWLESGDHLSTWVSLDENDNDLRLFLQYLIAAIQRIFPRSELHSEVLLKADRLPATDELARYLLNDLNQVPEPFILVLDDYQHIGEQSVHDLMATLLVHPAPTMHLVLLTRKDPSLPIATMRGRGLVTEVRASDLRFTSDDVAAFIHRILDVPIDEATADLIKAKTEGWVTGIRLAAFYLRGSKDLRLGVQALSGNTGHIAEYLMSEVLNLQDPEAASYLLETAILDRFCAPLCWQMHRTKAGNQEVGAEQFIRWLIKDNLLTIALDDEGRWFRYHHLFQDFLKNQLRKHCSDRQIAELHRIAGSWFAANNLIEEAIGHLIAGGDASSAIQLVTDYRYELLNASRFVYLVRLLALLPEELVAQSPLLISTRAFISVSLGNNTDFNSFTESATQMLATLSPISETYAMMKGEVLVLQSLVEMLSGDVQNALAHSRASFEYLPENALMIRSLGIGVISGCHQMMGSGSQAVASLRTAMSDPIWPTNIRARFHYYLCVVQYADGNLAGTMHTSRKLLRNIEDFPFSHTRALVNYFLGAGHYLRNEFEEAEPALLRVLDDRHTANPSYVVNSGGILACIYLAQNKEAAAVQVLDQIQAHCRDNGHTEALFISQAFEAEFALRRGDIRQAQQICKAVDFDIPSLPWLFYNSKLTPIKLLIAENTPQGLKHARRQLSDMEEQVRRVHRTNEHIEILALLALACHKQRDDSGAHRHLETAMELGEPGGWMRTFVDLGEPMANLLKYFLEHHPAHTYARHVLDACHIPLRTQAQPAVPRSAQTNGLTRRERELLSLMAEGLSNKEIAERLFVSLGTVKTHVKHIYKKLNVKRRVEAVKVGLGAQHSVDH